MNSPPSSIASLISRFRHDPPTASSERPQPPSHLLWWKDTPTYSKNALLDQSRTADAAVDAAMIAFTSTGGKPGPTDTEDGGDVISRALAVIKESRAMYEAGVLRGLPPSAPSSSSLAVSGHAARVIQETLASLPPLPPRRETLEGSGAAEVGKEADGAASAAAAEEGTQSNTVGGISLGDLQGLAASSTGPPREVNPLLTKSASSASSTFVCLPLGFAAQLPCLAPPAALLKLQQVPPSPSSLLSSSSSSSSSSAAQAAALIASWEEREDTLLEAINHGLECALAALNLPLRGDGEGGRGSGKMSDGAERDISFGGDGNGVDDATGGWSSTTGGGEGIEGGVFSPLTTASSNTAPPTTAASAAKKGGRQSSGPVTLTAVSAFPPPPPPSSTLDDLFVSAELIRFEDPEATVSRLRKRLAAVDEASSSALAPYSSIYQAAMAAVEMQLGGGGGGGGGGGKDVSRGGDHSTLLLGQSTIGLLSESTLLVSAASHAQPPLQTSSHSSARAHPSEGGEGERSHKEEGGYYSGGDEEQEEQEQEGSGDSDSDGSGSSGGSGSGSESSGEGAGVCSVGVETEEPAVAQSLPPPRTAPSTATLLSRLRAAVAMVEGGCTQPALTG